MKKCLLLFLIFSTSVFGTHHEISICAIFQNEGPYLKEWIDYHLGIGVDHFYLYNNESSDAYQEVLQPYMDAGIVQVSFWPNLWKDKYFATSCQPLAYQHWIDNYKNETEWIAFIDLDEFIVPMQEYTLNKCLQKHFSKAQAIWIQWRCFGTSFITLGPNDRLLTHLMLCSKKDNYWNGISKTIVRTEALQCMTSGATNPHTVDLLYGSYWNGSGKEWIPGVYHYDKYLRLNHYVFRDEKYFHEQKIPRYKGYKNLNNGEWVVPADELIQRNVDFCQDVDIRIHELIR